MPIDANTYFQAVGCVLGGLSVIALVLLFIRCREDYKKDHKPLPPMERKDLLKRIEAAKPMTPAPFVGLDGKVCTKPYDLGTRPDVWAPAVGICARCREKKELIWHTVEGADICRDCVFELLNWRLPAPGKFKAKEVKQVGLVTAQATLYDYYTKTEEGQDTAAAVRRRRIDKPAGSDKA